MLGSFHMRQQLQQKGPIYCLEQFNDFESPWIIFFHGYGADAQDLFSLSQYIELKKSCNWLFPNGILEVNIGPGMTGRAWWDIQLRHLNIDFSQLTPEGLPEARLKALKMIEQLKVPWSQIILGGFSQGSMLATDLYLHAQECPRGLVILSGSLVSQPEWQKLFDQKPQLREDKEFFISHGQQDTILKIGGAQKLHQFLVKNKMKGKFNSFIGGHEIPTMTLESLKEYLNSKV